MTTKPEKMTDDELAEAKRVADWLNSEGTSTCHRLLAHIAALTAERVAALAECDGSQRGGELCGACAGCVRLFRDRVQALEADVAEKAERWELARGEIRQQRERADRAETRAMAAERHFASIRQRAGDMPAMERLLRSVSIARHGHLPAMAEALVRYVMGEDATGAAPDPMHPNGHCTCAGEGTCPWCSRVRCAGCGQDGVDLCATCEAEAKRSQDAAADPSTVEAFATVRWHVLHGHGALRDVAAALSLLERRMGAMEKAMRTFCETAKRWHPPKAFGLTEDEARALIPPMRLALTDAPPVFTLEEVEAAMVRWEVDADTRDAVLAILRRMP